jgi:hypothetical protein
VRDELLEPTELIKKAKKEPVDVQEDVVAECAVVELEAAREQDKAANPDRTFELPRDQRDKLLQKIRVRLDMLCQKLKLLRRLQCAHEHIRDFRHVVDKPFNISSGSSAVSGSYSEMSCPTLL